MTERDSSIGAYRIRGRLGAGGMGEVFLAYDDRLGRHVAIKRIRGDIEMTPARRRRLRREARAAAGLSHPAIVQIHDILEHDDGDSIVMEYVEGRTLRQTLTAEGFDLGRAVDVARQLAEGLAAAHESGVVHRDLKAENVMVMPDGRARILDFGLAKPPPMNDVDVTLTSEGAVLGTLRTTSPQQALGRKVGAETDLYSLGVLLFEMLTGRLPFEGETVSEVYDQLLNVKAPRVRDLRQDVPKRLSALVQALLEKKPERRPRSAREVVRVLAETAELPGLSDRRSVSGGAASAAVSVAAGDASTLMPPEDAGPRNLEPRFLELRAREDSPAEAARTASSGRSLGRLRDSASQDRALVSRRRPGADLRRPSCISPPRDRRRSASW